MYLITFCLTQVKLEGFLRQFLKLWLLLYCVSCGRCLRHQACQIYVIVRLEALGILLQLVYLCFSPSQYQPTFSNMASLQILTYLSQVIFSLILWLLMGLSAATMEGYAILYLSVIRKSVTHLVSLSMSDGLLKKICLLNGLQKTVSSTQKLIPPSPRLLFCVEPHENHMRSLHFILADHTSLTKQIPEWQESRN